MYIRDEGSAAIAPHQSRMTDQTSQSILGKVDNFHTYKEINFNINGALPSFITRLYRCFFKRNSSKFLLIDQLTRLYGIT